MQWVSEFFQDIDRAWTPAAEKIRLRVIGSVALMLQTDYARGTRAFHRIERDVLGVAETPIELPDWI